MYQVIVVKDGRTIRSKNFRERLAAERACQNLRSRFKSPDEVLIRKSVSGVGLAGRR